MFKNIGSSVLVSFNDDLSDFVLQLNHYSVSFKDRMVEQSMYFSVACLQLVIVPYH